MICLLPFVWLGHLCSFVVTEMLKEYGIFAFFVLDWSVHKLQPLLQVAPTASAGPPCGPSLASSVPVVEAKKPSSASKYSDKDTIVFMRDCIKSLEAELKYTKGQSDVWRHKAKMALEAEEYLLSQISDASEQLLGELFASPRAFWLCFVLVSHT